MHRSLSALVGVLFLSVSGQSTELKPSTERQYREYLSKLEKRLDQRDNFLLMDSTAGLRARVKAGEVHIAENRPAHEPAGGLIHHYDGAVFIPGVTVKRVIEFVQNYDHHKQVYGPEVIDSKTLSRTGNDFHIRLRLLKKKLITVILETEHDVRYKALSLTRWESVSRSSKVAEVEAAGTHKEHELPPGTGHGFVWHLDSFWRFLQADGGVYVECTSVSLSRDIPFGMARLIRPIIEELPQESLRNVLVKTQEALKK
ncbi:MAG TPA: hypothetical protein VM120_04790 [Bryobacteraceae bacterium]|nr:hypothetical protein [Bryobacteraceae bacterium]